MDFLDGAERSPHSSGWFVYCWGSAPMRRDTLASFFQRAVLAALPLLGACGGSPGPNNCGNGTWTVDGGVGDLGCIARCIQPNGPSTPFCDEKTNSGGGLVTECHPDCTGRRPAGLAHASVRGSSLGAHFARMAHLEAASVPAFRRLRAELRVHGAPRRLVDACTRAARDEVRHARAVGRLARRFASRPPQVTLAAVRARPLLALAKENACEGCVRESFGALVATWQARTAEDRAVRRLMTGIAVDETRHAELAWEIDGWLRTRLGRQERAEVERARDEELAQLAAALDRAPDAELARAVGLPPPEAARLLHRAFAREVRRRTRA
jgi:hypothetical protein